MRIFGKIEKLAKYFLALAAIDQFDWLRDAIVNLKTKTNNSEIFANIDKVLSKTIYYNWKDKGSSDELLSLLDELIKLRKYFMSEKKFEEAHEVKKIIDLFNEEKRNFRNLPKKEFANISSGILYHGVPAKDAYSLLKNKEAVSGSAYTNFSFTPDITIAMKFGDVILAFDAKKLQRRGVKKMKYLPINEVSRRSTQGDQTEDYKNLFISETYRYEQEWALPLPFKFSDDDLKKVIIVRNNPTVNSQASFNRIKEILSTATSVPIEFMYTPSYSRHGLDETSEHELEKYKIREAVFNKILKPLSSIKLKCKPVLNDMFNKLVDEYGRESAKYIFEKSIEVIVLNRVLRDSDYLATNSNFESIHSLNTIIKFINQANAGIEDFRGTKLEFLIPYLKEIVAAKDDVIKAYHDLYLDNDDKIVNMIKGYSGTYYSGYREKLIEWMKNNPKKFEEKFINLPYEIKSKFSHFFDYIEDPRIFSDEFWRHYPVELLNNENFGLMSIDSIHKIYSNNPEYHHLINGFSGNSLRDWRYERANNAAKKNILEILKIVKKEGIEKISA